MTRNRYEAGFWDGTKSNEIGIEMTKIAESFSELNLIRVELLMDRQQRRNLLEVRI